MGGVDVSQHCGRPEWRRAPGLSIFPGNWAQSSRRVALECMTIERLTLALVVAAAVVPR
jgi:hypothetical protein